MMQYTENQSTDAIGEKTLDIIGEADKFNKWIYNTISPFCKGQVMEIGSGKGNISGFFLNDNVPTLLTDVRREYCKKLHDKFDGYRNLLGVENVDLTDPDFDQKHNTYFNSSDTVFAINVIEHIPDDGQAIKNCVKLLKTGGSLIIMVPSYQYLFNDFDRSLGHFRRYNLRSVCNLLLKNDLSIIHRQYYNFIGMIGWFISGNILKNKIIPEKQMKLYNYFVPLFRLLDTLILRSCGLSSIVVGVKNI